MATVLSERTEIVRIKAHIYQAPSSDLEYGFYKPSAPAIPLRLSFACSVSLPSGSLKQKKANMVILLLQLIAWEGGNILKIQQLCILGH